MYKKYYKIALKYSNTTGTSIFLDGVKVDNGSNTSYTEGDFKSVWFRNYYINRFRGNVRQLLYFNKALTDTELERLTSSDITQVLRNYNRRGEILGATYESAHVQTKLNELF